MIKDVIANNVRNLEFQEFQTSKPSSSATETSQMPVFWIPSLFPTLS